MKKRHLVLVFFFQNIFYIFSFSQGYLKDTLFVESVSFNATTIIRVTCPEFEQNFEKSIKIKILTNKDSLFNLDSFLNGVHYEKRNSEIDVRAKFIYVRKDCTRREICMSKFDIVVDGRLVRRNRRFWAYLKSMVK